jgi:TRAP-type C4-dicarboxylate transport system substrate-binding protein
MLHKMCIALPCLALGAMLATGPAAAQQPGKHDFKMVGTWNFTTHFKEIESPYFTKGITEKSGGNVKVDMKSITVLNLSGFEVVDLTRKGVYDIVAGVIAYVADRSPELEAMDLAGTVADIDTQIKALKAYRPVVAREFEAKYGVHLLAMTLYPSQQMWCNKPVNKMDDVKGLKIRVYGSSLGDLMKGLGGVPVTIAFGEVVPALQKGVADCGITGTLPAYDAKWREVVTHIYKLGLGWGPSFIAINKRRWDGLDAATKEFLNKEMAAYEERAWAGTRENDEQGFACNTGKGKCRFGEPGKMTVVDPSEDDKKRLKAAVEENVLKAWAKRCSESCVKEWNNTIGKLVGLSATK